MKKASDIATVFFCLIILLSGCRREDRWGPEFKVEEVVLNVDVILPNDIREQWTPSIEWAQENIARAQQLQSRRIRLNLRYHDEDNEDMDKLGYRLTHPESDDAICNAIIGPYHSSNAGDILKYARKTRLPVVMPTCTSAELQRTNTRNTYAWFLTESDITQCEMMLSVAQSLAASDVALIHSNDTYGKSFMDWFAYYAVERGLHIAGGTHEWQPGEDLSPFLKQVYEESDSTELWILLALSNAHDYVTVCSQINDYWFNEILLPYKEGDKMVYMRNINADTSLDRNLLDDENNYTFFLGVTPSGSMNYGFPQAYLGRYGYVPFNGAAQVYDALTILALGATLQAASPDACIVEGRQVEYSDEPYGPGLTDYMRSVVSSENGLSVQWDAAGLAMAFDELSHGRSIYMTGATGGLNFDKETSTKILNTTYMVWDILNRWTEEPEVKYWGLVEPIIYLSTMGSSNEASTTEFWKLEKRWNQVFNHDAVNHELPDLTDRWAVVITPSTTWTNYRHQSDAFAIYQTLLSHGYDDDHIVLIVEDNLADDSLNIYSGQIFAEPGDDVRRNAVVDYRFSDLQGPDDLADIIMGRSSSRLPNVISPTESSNVFFFWSGHGGKSDGPYWGNEDADAYFGTERMKEIVTRMNEQDMYRRMMLAVETCYSGKWGEALTGLPDVLVLTAANSNETSKADVYDAALGTYLSNAFTRTFRQEITRNSNVSIYDLYRELARTTTGSHVSIYNQANYGSVYEETMREFFSNIPKQQ